MNQLITPKTRNHWQVSGSVNFDKKTRRPSQMADRLSIMKGQKRNIFSEKNEDGSLRFANWPVSEESAILFSMQQIKEKDRSYTEGDKVKVDSEQKE